MRLFRTATVAAMGAAAAYFLDPEQGAGRRNQFRDQFLSRARSATDDVAGAAQGAAQKAYGAARESATSATSDSEPPNDQTLKAKVESEIFRPADAPKDSVDVDVADGVVALRGQPDDGEAMEKLVEAARAVEGVKDVRTA